MACKFNIGTSITKENSYTSCLSLNSWFVASRLTTELESTNLRLEPDCLTCTLWLCASLLVVWIVSSGIFHIFLYGRPTLLQQNILQTPLTKVSPFSREAMTLSRALKSNAVCDLSKVSLTNNLSFHFRLPEQWNLLIRGACLSTSSRAAHLCALKSRSSWWWSTRSTACFDMRSSNTGSCIHPCYA